MTRLHGGFCGLGKQQRTICGLASRIENEGVSRTLSITKRHHVPTAPVPAVSRGAVMAKLQHSSSTEQDINMPGLAVFPLSKCQCSL